MGGYNSGSNQRRSRYGRADGTWSLDVRALHRAGWLEPGQWGSYSAGLNLLAKKHQLTLMYDATFKDGTQRPIGETLQRRRQSTPRWRFGGVLGLPGQWMRTPRQQALPKHRPFPLPQLQQTRL